MNKSIIAIDPGLRGAIAHLDHKGAIVEDMPVADGAVDAAGLASIIGMWQRKGCEPYSRNEIHAYVEEQHARPPRIWDKEKEDWKIVQGSSSTFNFGCSFGKVLGVLAALGVPYTLVTPAAWKKTFHLGRDKEQSRARALELFPALADDLKRKKDEGRAEALLLALYGKMQERGDQ